MFCIHCGAQIDDSAASCCSCGKPVAALNEQPILGGLIPRNSHALVAYYCGIFSLIPCMGIILGPIAFITGILGIKYANKEPNAKGKIHAWIGIIFGGIFFLIYFSYVLLCIIGMCIA